MSSGISLQVDIRYISVLVGYIGEGAMDGFTLAFIVGMLVCAVIMYVVVDV